MRSALRMLRLLVSWTEFVAGLEKAFHGIDPAEEDRPLAAKQLRYFYANLAIAKLLQANGQRPLMNYFVEIAEALYDTSEGKDHALFGLERPRKRGAPPDTSDIWRIRANVCIAMEYMLAGGKSEKDAFDFAVKRETDFAPLIRPDSPGLRSSLASWMKAFASKKASHTVAQAIFEDGVAQISDYQLSHTGNETQQFGEGKLRDAAALAASLPQKTK